MSTSNQTPPLLIMMLGIPGSGKTYFSQRWAEKLHGVRLNSDAIRISIFGSLEAMDAIYNSEDRDRLNDYTFGAMDYMTNQLLAAGICVAYDAIHTHRTDRVKREEIARQNGALPVLVRVSVPRIVSLRRITERPVADDSRQFSLERAEEVLTHFETTTEPPTSAEYVIDIDGEMAFEDQYRSYERQLEEILAIEAAKTQ